MKYHSKEDFVVTHYVPCPVCNELKPEKEIIKRYVGIRWTPVISCQSCYDTAKATEDKGTNPNDIYGY